MNPSNIFKTSTLNIFKNDLKTQNTVKLPIFTMVGQTDLFEEKLIMSIFSNFKKALVITEKTTSLNYSKYSLANKCWILYAFSYIYLLLHAFLGFPHSSVGKESPCFAGDPSSIPGSGRSPGEGNGNPFQCSYLENPMDKGALQVHEVSSVTHNLVTKPPPPQVFFKS